MLSSLHIQNIAVIEKADIVFDTGLNVLTGETGAGKSIIIDAIGAVMGYRVSRDIIRTGENAARVVAVFEGLGQTAADKLNELGFAPDDGCVHISRELQRDGKNVIRINGLPATTVMLRELSPYLVAIHGQHDTLEMADETAHIGYLDNFADSAHLLADYKEKYERYTSVRKEIAEIDTDEQQKARRLDILRFQIGEIDAARLTPGEDEMLAARRNVLRNAEKIAEGVNGAYELLCGGEGFDGAVALLEGAARHVSEVSKAIGDNELYEKIEQLCYQARDAAESVRDIAGSLDARPGELDAVESRLDVIYRLTRKYGGDVETVLAYRDRLAEEAESIETSELRLEQLAAELKRAAAEAAGSAGRLSAHRREKALELAKKVQGELAFLDMKGARFVVDMTGGSTADDLGRDGWDKVVFLISANAGEQPRAVARIASGGELSRIMLAMKTVLAASDAKDCLVFDEIDAGISGRAADKVGRKLKSLGASRQVMCVTHLPQIAVYGDCHILVEKKQKDGRTVTGAAQLNHEGRINEIARMSSGETITGAARQNAAEQLENAQR